MEKRGVVSPDVTPDVEEKIPAEKAASAKEKRARIRDLDDDVTKRAADAVARKIGT